MTGHLRAPRVKIIWTLGKKGNTVKVVKFPIRLGDLWMQLKDRKRLLRLIEIQDVSRRDVARAAGWSSHSYFNRMCNGLEDTCKPEPALRIAKFLGVAVDDLFLTKVEEKIEQLEEVPEHSKAGSRKSPSPRTSSQTTAPKRGSRAGKLRAA
ncbi:helix-turn-helix transcriptional regulator [Glutamicibacter sp.]|uniref:helix-turn-helix transcriptional regulator n=1 Tax=Glutamicibacter sp. TaxID=1931995 RepID=UPI0028BE7253|nr:helix-turn-helix transcriptional regulator [Glutamicibacter sp.]